MMVILTVIGRKLAREGAEFTFMGPLSDCKECKVRNICFHLERGTKYRVVAARDKSHECPIHEEGVRVVQVEPVPRKAVVRGKLALEGTNFEYDLPNCRARHCRHRQLCFLPGLEKGQKRRVVKVLGAVECGMGQNRTAVMLE
jgi:hypothetical protein